MAFMRARFEQFDETPGDFWAALDHYREAVEADPMLRARMSAWPVPS